MPNRIIRDGILRSEKVNALEPLTELFYRRLMSVVDDYGRTEAHPTLLRSSCYPLLIDKVDEPTVKNHLKECQNVGLIQLYTVEGKHFIQLRNFNQQVRAKVSKFPQPPADDIACVADAMQMKSNEHLDVDVDVDGGECDARAGEFAEMPTGEEVIDHGNGGAAIPAWYCKHYHEAKEIRRSWLNGHGKLINWRREIVAWFNKDGKPLRENEHAKSNRGGGRKTNANAGTFNEGIGHLYANAAKLKS